MKIVNKIGMTFFIAGILIVLTVAPIVYINVRNDLEKAIFTHLITTAESRAAHIRTLLRTLKGCISLVAKPIVILDLLQADEKDLDYGNKVDAVNVNLERTKEIREDIYELFVLNRDGKIIASSSSNKTRIGLDRSNDPYFLGAKSGQFIKDAYYSKTAGQRSLALSAPITDRETGEFLGIAVARISLDALNKITTARGGLGETGEIYLVNKDGYMITPSRFMKDVFLKVNVAENVRRCLEDVKKFGPEAHRHEPLVVVDYRGETVLGAQEYMDEMGWFLLAEMDTDEILSPLNKLKILFCGVIFFVPIVAYLLGTFLAGLITRPLYKLHKGTELIGRGNLDHKVGTGAKDEIGQLSRAFDNMTEKLRKTTTSMVNLRKEISERKKAQEELKEAYNDLKEAQSQLIQSEKLAAIGQLAAGVAHEINNPLFAILGEVEMLLKDKNKDRDTMDSSKVILEQSERIRKIIESFLQFSRKKEFEYKPLDINDALKKSISLLSYREKIENIEIIQKIKPNLPKVLADNNQIQQVFLCIMLNAVQAMEKGGRLTIRTRREKVTEDERRKTDKFKLGTELMIIEFEDTGKGIDEETLKKVFDPFFSTKERGTGLGLSVCYGIIEAHKGTIEAYSKLGEGSTFIVKFPIVKGGS